MRFLIPVVLVLSFGFTSSSFKTHEKMDHVEFVCMKKHMATKTCHYNFFVDGAKYRYVDIGCKFNKTTDKLLEKASAGEIALAKDWKIACPESKDDR